MKIPSSFSAFRLSRDLPADVYQRLSALALPPLDTLGAGEISGWSGPRHALDSIPEQCPRFAAHLVKAARKLPGELVRAEFELEALAEMQARGVSYLRRAEKAEIRQMVIDRLLPATHPSLQSIRVFAAAAPRLIFASATTDAQIDSLYFASRQAGIDLHFRSPEIIAAECGLDTVHLPKALGPSFLTWLWFFSECGGAIFRSQNTEFSVGIDGPLVFCGDNACGAIEAAMRKGVPTASAEAAAALHQGKQLHLATLLLASGDRAFSCRLDSARFVFRSVLLPPVDELDPEQQLEDRILSMTVLYQAVADIFCHFLLLRDSAEWPAIAGRMSSWIAERRT